MIDKRPKPDVSEEDDDRCGYTDASRVTGLPIGTLYSKVALKQIPHIRLGKRLVRFSRRALLEWLAQHLVPVKQNP